MMSKHKMLQPHSKTVIRMIKERPEFRVLRLQSVVELCAEGEPGVAKFALADYIKATIGYAALAKQIGKSPQSMRRMFSPAGSPSSTMLSQTIAILQKHQGVEARVSQKPIACRRTTAIKTTTEIPATAF